MTERTRTVTETIGYEAFDGSFFTSRDECKRYEETAYAVAKRAASAYVMSDTVGVDFNNLLFGCSDDRYVVYDIVDTTALQVVNSFLYLTDAGTPSLSPDLIGKQVAIHLAWGGDFWDYLGTMEEVLGSLMESVTALFTDKRPSANVGAADTNA